MLGFVLGTLQTDIGDSATPYHAVTLAIGQLVVTLLFTVVTGFLLINGKLVPDNLWTLNVAIVSYYLSQRIPITHNQTVIKSP